MPFSYCKFSFRCVERLLGASACGLELQLSEVSLNAPRMEKGQEDGVMSLIGWHRVAAASSLRLVLKPRGSVCVSRRPCNRFKIATTLTYHDLMVELKATGSSNNIQQHPFRVLKPPLIPFKERHVYLIYSVHTLKHFIAPDLIGGFVSEPCSAPGGPCSL